MRIKQKSWKSPFNLVSVVEGCMQSRHFGLEVGGEGLDHTVVCYTTAFVLLCSQSTRPSCDCSQLTSPVRFPSPELLLGINIKQWDQLPSFSGLEEDPPFPAPCSSLRVTLGGCRPFFELFALSRGWFNGAVNVILLSHCSGFI